MKEIYQQTVEEVFERVNGKKSGLTSEQVKRSREKCGWNELTEGKKKGILQIFFEGAVYFKSIPYRFSSNFLYILLRTELIAAMQPFHRIKFF